MTPNDNLSDDETSPPDFWQNAQQVLQAGEQASRLLQSPVFNMAYRMQMEDTINRWLTSKPKETNLRDSLYYEAQAQVAMTTKLQAFVEQAQAVLAAQAAEHDGRGKRAEYLDTQGFGYQ
jgi:hypothetical protein